MIQKKYDERPSFLGQEDLISRLPEGERFKFLCDDCGEAVDARWQGAGYLFPQECHACGRHAARARSYDAEKARAYQEKLHGPDRTRSRKT